MSVFFEVVTPRGCMVRTTKDYWQYIIQKKHPYMVNREDIVINTLKNPDEICKSRFDPTVYLYYRQADRLYCVIVKEQSDKRGFLITAYPVDKVKEGDVIWKR